METGLQMIRNEATESQEKRVQSMYELFSFYEDELATVIQRWKQETGP